MKREVRELDRKTFMEWLIKKSVNKEVRKSLREIHVIFSHRKQVNVPSLGYISQLIHELEALGYIEVERRVKSKSIIKIK